MHLSKKQMIAIPLAMSLMAGVAAVLGIHANSDEARKQAEIARIQTRYTSLNDRDAEALYDARYSLKGVFGVSGFAASMALVVSMGTLALLEFELRSNDQKKRRPVIVLEGSPGNDPA